MFVSNLKPEIVELAKKIEVKVKPYHERVDETAFFNQQKVLAAFRKHQVSDFHLNPSTGYGYDDEGRDNLERVYAEVFGAESALVRSQIVDGGEKDTGSLKDFDIQYRHIDLINDREIDWEGVRQAINEKTKMVAIQRSKGYAIRPSFTIDQIREMCEKIREIKQDVVIFVDNCYGEFVERLEPTEVGADLMAGSLIKNPGGGLAKTGGYIAGRADLVEKCAYRMTSPGIGGEAGASLNTLIDFYQGFFLAPHIVAQSLKGAIFTSAILEEVGMKTTPHYTEYRTDLIQSVSFQTSEQMIAFCQEIQAASPINAHYAPVPSYMPGYEDDVIMAAGTFVQGSSIELTADGPIRPPYTAYVQGGLTYEHVKYAVCSAVQKLKSI